MMAEPAVIGLSEGKDAAELDLPMAINSESKLLATLQKLALQNDHAVSICNNISKEANLVTTSQHKVKENISQQLADTFRPEVLQVLKRNADQLLALKNQHIAEKQASTETSKRLMSWVNSHQQGTATTGDDTVTVQQDAVKHGRFKYFQLPGSSVAAGSDSRAMRFWQTGLCAGTGAPCVFTHANAAMDQQQLQKSLSAMLFGRNRRSSSSSQGTAPISPGRVSDTGGSWRSSDSGAGNRRTSHRPSDTGPFWKSASKNLGQVAARSSNHQLGSLWASLTAGEGPLSKSHSLLAKPGPQADQVMGKSLDIVAEDEREGHDSPQPGAVPSSSKSSQNLVTTIRQQVAGGGRASSPIESFSFGNRAVEEPHSPNLLRASVSSRQLQAASSLPAAAGTAGPLVRSSLALHSSRVDPFDAPEPQLQPFVEQMKAEDLAMKASQTAAATGLMGALRRSFSGPAKAAMLLQGGKGKSGCMSVHAPPGMGPLAADAGVAVQKCSMMQHQAQTEAAALACSDGCPTAGDNVEMLDLDASRAYAMGVHSMLHGMATALTGSETSSKQPSPRTSELGAGLTTSTTNAEAAAARTTAPHPAYSSEIEPAEQQPSRIEAAFEEPSLGPVQEVQQQLQQLLGQSNGRHLTPPCTAQTPQASGCMRLHQHRQRAAATAIGGAGAASRPLRPSSASAADSRLQSQGASSAGQATLGLPVLGQAPIDILGRPSASLLQQERRPLSSSMSVRLTDVYQQTAGNLNPLSAGLNTFKRSSSHGTRPPRAPSSRTSPRTSTYNTSQPGCGVPSPAGPLAAQRSSSMLRTQGPQPAGLVSPRDNKTPAWGWHSLGLPTGPGAPPADPAFDPASLGTGNKYAASWGLVDAATTAAQGGALSRQASANGGLSRQQSAVMQGQLSRQNSTMSMAPRSPFQQQQMQQQATGRQQWHQGGAAGRYAGPASNTPTSQSPRSDRGTPGCSEQYGGMTSVAAAAAAVRSRQASAAAALHSRRISDDADSDVSGDDGYDTAEEHSASSSYASSVRGVSASRGESTRAATASAHVVAAKARGSPVPAPPTFLTTAQAAVAAQWSPNKHASAMAQAPAYARGALDAEVSDVMISERQGLQLPGLSYLSPREAGADGGVSDAGYGRPAHAIAAASQTPQAAYAGGYSVYSPLAPPAGPLAGTKPPGTAPLRVAGHYQQHQQQQRVFTAVDLARSRSGMRRTSSSSSGGQGGYAKGYGAGYLSNNGYRGGQPPAASTAAGKATYFNGQQRPEKQRPY